MKSKLTLSKHIARKIGLGRGGCPKRKNELRNGSTTSALTVVKSPHVAARDDVSCATTEGVITTMLFGSRMPKDWLHEAEKHLISSGINPDNHIFQAILCVILEIRKRNSVGKRKQ